VWENPRGASAGVGVWEGSLCTAVTPTCTDKEAGSNGVGLSRDTRLPCPKEMNGLKILSSTRLLVQTNLPTKHQPSRLHHRLSHNLGSSHTRTSEQTHPQISRYTPRCPSVVLWTPCSGVEWRAFEPTIRVWRSGTTRKQPANLAVEAAEESLCILPDYTPTVRPPPKRC
jgi:hypothetical protein